MQFSVSMSQTICSSYSRTKMGGSDSGIGVGTGTGFGSRNWNQLFSPYRNRNRSLVVILKWSRNRSRNQNARVESESEPGPSGTAHLCSRMSVFINVDMPRFIITFSFMTTLAMHGSYFSHGCT